MTRTLCFIICCLLAFSGAHAENATLLTTYSVLEPDSTLVLLSDSLIAGTASLNFIERAPDNNYVIVGATNDYPSRVIITKYTPAGERLWVSYLGSSLGQEYCNGMTIDSQGNIIITGRTYDYNNTLDYNGFDNTYGGGQLDAFVAKYTGAGELQWASYMGGTEIDSGYGLATSSNGDIYLAGVTWSPSDIARDGTDLLFGGYTDAFLAKITASGVLVWTSYYGGSGYDKGSDVVVDGDHVYMLGTTWSENDIAFNGFDNTLGVDLTSFGGHDDAFLVKFDQNGNRIWSTYFGGDRPEYGEKIAIDPSGNLIIAGTTYNDDIAFNGYDMSFNGYYDVFLARFTPSGERIWSTYYGGEESDDILGLHVDEEGDIIITGVTLSKENIANKGLVDEFTGKPYTNNGFIARFTNNGEQVWSTYYYNNGVQGAATNVARDIFCVGHHLDTIAYTSTGLITKIGYESATVVGTESPISKHVELYPNPTRGEVTISVPTDCQVRLVEVYDACGLRMLPQTPYGQDGLYKFSLTGPPSVYLVKVVTTKGLLYRRVSLE